MTLYQILSVIGMPSLLASILISAFNFGKSRAMKALKEKDVLKEKQEREHKMLMNGVEAILHNLVYTQGKKYIDRGEITISDMKDFEYLYQAYHDMGGNGTGTEIYERVKELKVR